MSYKDRVQKKYRIMATKLEIKHPEILDYDVEEEQAGDSGNWHRQATDAEVTFRISQFSFNLGDVADIDAAERLKQGDVVHVNSHVKINKILTKIDDDVKIEKIKTSGDTVIIDCVLFATGFDPTLQAHHGR